MNYPPPIEAPDDDRHIKLFGATSGRNMRYIAVWNDTVYERALDHLERQQSDEPYVHIDHGGLNLCGYEGQSVDPGRATEATCPDCRARQREWRL